MITKEILLTEIRKITVPIVSYNVGFGLNTAGEERISTRLAEKVVDHIYPMLFDGESWHDAHTSHPACTNTKAHKNGRTTSKSDKVLCVCRQKSGKRFIKEGFCEIRSDLPGRCVWRITGTIDDVTHWRPLPELPEETKDA